MQFIVERFIQILKAHMGITVEHEFINDHYELHLSGLPSTLRDQLRSLTFISPTAIYDSEKSVYLQSRHPVFIPQTGDDLRCTLYDSDYAKKINEIDVVLHEYTNSMNRTYRSYV